VSSGESPVEDDLSWRLVVFFSKFNNDFLFLKIFSILSNTWIADWRVGSWYNVDRFHELDEVSLHKEWVEFDLIDYWWDLGVRETISQQLNVEVGNSDTLAESHLYKFLQLSIYNMHWYLSMEEADWPVDHVHVYIV